ncbi:MAG: hypothetical protein Q7R49_05145 [Candidatus Daviesbacteria bacterium]|nr:hypothetical protein [Candidatus Daviesbacteria bacterium]
MVEDNKLKILTAGLVLAALAIGYFIITQKINNQASHIANQPSASSVPTPTPELVPLPSATPAPIPSTTKGGTNTLPKTGFPLTLVGVFAMSALVSGYFLRKFPE